MSFRVKRMKKYNHMFDIAFTVESDNLPEDVTGREMFEGLMRRITRMIADNKNIDKEFAEACGLPADTFENVVVS